MQIFNEYQKPDQPLSESRLIKDIKNNLLALQNLFKSDYTTPRDITGMDWHELTPAQQAELAKATKVVWQALEY